MRTPNEMTSLVDKKKLELQKYYNVKLIKEVQETIKYIEWMISKAMIKGDVSPFQISIDGILSALSSDISVEVFKVALLNEILDAGWIVTWANETALVIEEN